MIKQVSVVNFDDVTGEVYSNKTSSYQSKLWVDGKGARLKTRNYHYTMYQDTRLCDIVLDKNDLFKTYLLIEHIYKDTNIIYSNHSRYSAKPASVCDMAKILGVNPRRVKEYLKRMKEIGLIGELKINIKDTEYISYVFNPIYINSCRYINNTLYLLFKPYIDQYCPKWVQERYRQLNSENIDT